MAAPLIIKTFKDIQDAVLEELKIQPEDTNALNRIKRDINFVYANEVIPRGDWNWLLEEANIIHRQFIELGTASVTQESRNVTLTDAPAFSVKGYRFKADGNEDIYDIAEHTAGGTAIVLTTDFVAATNAAVNYNVWTDKLPLPSDLRKVVEVRSYAQRYPLLNLGLQEFRTQSGLWQSFEGFPNCYSVNNYVDPEPFSAIGSLPALSTRASDKLVRTLVFATTVAALVEVGDRIEVTASGDSNYNGKFIISSVSTTTITYTALERFKESATADATLLMKAANEKKDEESFRELWIYPSLVSNEDVTLKVDYIKKETPLNADTDEPLMPMNDRAVLVYGALSRQWVKHRDPETFTSNEGFFQTKLSRMLAEISGSIDLPNISLSSTWVSRKRQRPFLRRSRRR